MDARGYVDGEGRGKHSAGSRSGENESRGGSVGDLGLMLVRVLLELVLQSLIEVYYLENICSSGLHFAFLQESCSVPVRLQFSDLYPLSQSPAEQF